LDDIYVFIIRDYSFFKIILKEFINMDILTSEKALGKIDIALLYGGKTGTLARLCSNFSNIPEWFALPVDCYFKYKEGRSKEISEEIQMNLNLFEEDCTFAVRSSAIGEDGKEHSFAGQFSTYLNVPKKEVFEKVLKVWESAFTDRVNVYKKEKGLKGESIPGVLVQRMVKADSAGVAFSVNPVTGNTKECIVNAVMGLGDKLVDGEVNADSYTIQNGKIMNIRLAGESQILTLAQIQKIEDFCRRVSDFLGRAQDLEWAFEDGKLYLLQARPVTSLRQFVEKSGKINIWDNSNISESYNGVTTPLTFSFIRLAYEHVYREMFKLLGVSNKKLQANDRIFSNMLGLHQGQVYYNLLSWYKVLTILPGYKMNAKFMEQMMGVKEELPSHVRDEMPKNLDSKSADLWNLISSMVGLIRQYRKNEKNVDEFFNLLNKTIQKRDLQDLSLYELAEYYREIEGKLLKHWNAPVINDFFAMIFYGLLKNTTKKWCRIEDENKFNGLLRNTGDIISAEPAKRVREMAHLVCEDEEITHSLIYDDVPNIQRKLSGEIKIKIDQYIEKFGDRCINELKLESETLKDNPLNLYRAVGNFALKIKSGKLPPVENVFHEGEILKKLVFRKSLYQYILKNARRMIKNRENLRFERTRVFGVVRNIFRKIGSHLCSFGVIDDQKDIFYLELVEVLGYIEGTSTTSDLRGLVQVRKKEFSQYNSKLEDRFETYDCVHLSARHTKSNLNLEINGDTLQGLGCCPGIVRGIARVITDPKDAIIQPGEILVAQRTDPGWIMLFPIASGILVEYGSLLSHAAIVVREMSIPAVVSVRNLFAFIKDGDLIELDGEKGIVKNLSRKDQTSEK
jgi:rifampicin phosphotransferase